MAPLPGEALSLLLLPALSSTSTPAALRSAYKTTLETLLPQLVAQKSLDSAPGRLDIAVVLTDSHPSETTSSRTAIFSRVQRLFSSVYSLVVTSAAKLNIDLDFSGGLDVRIFVLDPRLSALPQDVVGKQPLAGPLVDILTFVKSSRPYTTLYAVDGEAGEHTLKQLITAYNSINAPPPSTHRLPSGPAISQPRAAAPSKSESVDTLIDDRTLQAHASVAVGGTFDHLHLGHKLLLTATILAADYASHVPRLITVGITGDELLVNKKYGTVVESWDVRQQRTAEFVESILVFHPDIASVRKTEHIDQPGPNGRVVRITYSTVTSDTNTGTDAISINYTRISDPYGPTIADENISALVISAETRAGGKAVNDKRGEKGWGALEVFEVDVLDAGVVEEESEDASEGQKEEKNGFESKISSTEIRKRLFERQQQGSM